MPPHVPAKMSLASLTIPVLGEEGGAVPVKAFRMRVGQNDEGVIEKVTRANILEQWLSCCACNVQKDCMKRYSEQEGENNDVY